jgi:hypothetical protein
MLCKNAKNLIFKGKHLAIYNTREGELFLKAVIYA